MTAAPPEKTLAFEVLLVVMTDAEFWLIAVF